MTKVKQVPETIVLRVQEETFKLFKQFEEKKKEIEKAELALKHLKENLSYLGNQIIEESDWLKEQGDDYSYYDYHKTSKEQILKEIAL
jgi:hypothetical protein